MQRITSQTACTLLLSLTLALILALLADLLLADQPLSETLLFCLYYLDLIV